MSATTMRTMNRDKPEDQALALIPKLMEDRSAKVGKVDVEKEIEEGDGEEG